MKSSSSQIKKLFCSCLFCASRNFLSTLRDHVVGLVFFFFLMTTARFDRVSLNENQSYHNSQLEKRKISQGANEDIEYHEQTA